jgi:GST-like protein
MSWLFWQMGSVPYLGGGFGHFYAYAPEQYEYPINRWAEEFQQRPAVQRGRRVNKAWGPEEEQIIERHSAADFD